MQRKFPCVIIRGGTSKGLYFHQADLPEDPQLRDWVLVSAMGGPDPCHINGLGGAISSTRKVAIIGPPTQPGTDVNYTFGQVSVLRPFVDYKGNCGNISSGVGPFAIDEGLVEGREPVTTVRIFNTNTRRVIEALVPIIKGKAAVKGDCAIAGVPETGARILLRFIDPGGSVTGKLLPTGRSRETLTVGGSTYTVSIVDAGNPAVFVAASELGLKGTELPEEIEAVPGMLEKIEDIRSTVAELIGIVARRSQATQQSPLVPLIACVSEATDYVNSRGRHVTKGEIDFVARVFTSQRAHKVYALTGAICTSVAARIKGTVVNEVAKPESAREQWVRFGHPAGVLSLEVKTRDEENGGIASVAVERTARRLMDGFLLLPEKLTGPGVGEEACLKRSL